MALACSASSLNLARAFSESFASSAECLAFSAASVASLALSVAFSVSVIAGLTLIFPLAAMFCFFCFSTLVQAF